MADTMTKAEFLDILRRERARWTELLAQLPDDRLTQPGAAGHWSVKDVIAHVTWGEQEMLGVLQNHALVGSDLWNVSEPERNAAVFEQNRDRSLEDVRTEAEQVYQQLVAALETLSDEDLNDPSRYADMPAEWVPWQLLAGNTYRHYQEHMPDLQASSI